MSFTYLLNEVNLNMISIVGRKSAYLGELYRIGFDIPEGFVISSKGVEEILSEIRKDINSILSSVDLNSASDLEHKSNIIKDLILKTDIPEEIRKEIFQRFKELNSKYVAVRSTVTSPMIGSSHAGEYETDLFVTEESLINSIKRVISSYFSPRGLIYRLLSKENSGLAILVQRMINPSVAGTAFSLHPVTEENDYVYIESAFGLGESVTKGLVIPDQYVVSKSTRSLISKRISSKAIKIIYDFDEKSVKPVELHAESLLESLSERDAIRVANITIGVEEIFKRNVNIEWAMEGNKIYLLEVRGVKKILPEP